MDWIKKWFQRVRCELRIHPGGVFLIRYIKGVFMEPRHHNMLSFGGQCFKPLAYLLFREKTIHISRPIAGNSGVKIDEVGNPLWRAVAHPLDDSTTHTMADEYNLVEIFIRQHPEDILDMRF